MKTWKLHAIEIPDTPTRYVVQQTEPRKRLRPEIIYDGPSLLAALSELDKAARGV